MHPQYPIHTRKQFLSSKCSRLHKGSIACGIGREKKRKKVEGGKESGTTVGEREEEWNCSNFLKGSSN